jgi:molybdenum cofactor cytidylyltransferase
MSLQPALPDYSLAVVVLAAGRSRRMGKPKLLLPWRDTSVLGHLLRQWRELRPAQVTVVHATHDSALSAELDRLQFSSTDRIANPDPDRGMFSSVQCASQWTGWIPALTHWTIVLGDQPHLSRETLQAILDHSASHPDQVCQPIFQSHRRHPVILPRSIFLNAGNSAAPTLKDFLAEMPASYCPLDDPGLGLDIDLPEDYERAIRLYG